MQLAEISIRRPVFATVLSLLVLLVGAVSFTRLTVREYPKIDEPVVTVSVRYAGASAEVIESQVTKPLEDSIAGIDAVDVITSISRAEQSQISVRFRLEKDADNAAAEVRDRTARVRNRLPDAVDEPVIAKVEADASPVMWLAFSSDTRSPLEINDLLNRIVKPRLQTVTGVADVPIYGERRYAMRIWLDPERMAGYRLTTQDVEDAIRRNNLELPAGRTFELGIRPGDTVRHAFFGKLAESRHRRGLIRIALPPAMIDLPSPLPLPWPPGFWAGLSVKRPFAGDRDVRLLVRIDQRREMHQLHPFPSGMHNRLVRFRIRCKPQRCTFRHVQIHVRLQRDGSRKKYALGHHDSSTTSLVRRIDRLVDRLTIIKLAAGLGSVVENAEIFLLECRGFYAGKDLRIFRFPRVCLCGE